ncbi:MAG: prepilin-type N-terminal cleavage/methylation domain-containing protein [Steroidobacteraceae bacterium]
MIHRSGANVAHQSGFTLLEVMVAFAIFALSVGALYESFAGSLRRTLKAEVQERAWLSAQSLLAAIRVRPAPWPAGEEGITRTGLDWKLSTSPYQSGADPKSPWQAYQVVIEVHPHLKAAGTVVLRSVELLDVGSVAMQAQADGR